MRERVKFALVATMLMTLAGISWLLPLRYITEGGPAAGIVLAVLVSSAITALSALYIRHEHRNAREGYPLIDERSRAVRAQTGNYAFFVSAAAALVLFVVSISTSNLLGTGEIQAGEVLFAVLLMMVSAYMGVWALLTFKWRMD